MQQINQKTQPLISLVPACNFTQDERRLLAYNLPPLEPLAVYARNQCKFIDIVPSLEVRQDPVLNKDGEIIGYKAVVLKNVTVWRDHNGVIQHYFDSTEAQRWVNWFKFCGRHSKGELRGKPVELVHWQEWITREFYGWRDIGTPYRRYKYLFKFVPRKNNKSLWFSIAALGMLLIDKEQGPEVYCMGSAKEQSETLFEMAQFSCGFEEGAQYANPEIVERVTVGVRAIESKGNGGTFQPLPFSPLAFHGKNPHCAIVEEYHAHLTDMMRDVAETGQGIRKQPAVFIDTTAGESVDTPCFEELLIARNIRDGALVVPNYLPVIFEAGENDPWDSLETAAKCNPMFGISLQPKFFIDQIAKCKLKPLKKKAYLQLQLNRFVSAPTAAFDYDEWLKCVRPFDVRDFKGQKMYGGLDLASVNDLTCMAGIFAPDGPHGIWYAHAHFWCPESTVTTKRTLGSYELWKEQGFLVATPGDATDYEFVEETIKAYNLMFQIHVLNGDRYNSLQLLSMFKHIEGLKYNWMGQAAASMTEPVKEIQRRVKSGRIIFNNPILSWMAKTVILKGNDRACYFGKLTDAQKIDGMVALAMAAAGALAAMNEEPPGPEERGFLFA